MSKSRTFPSGPWTSTGTICDSEGARVDALDRAPVAVDRPLVHVRSRKTRLDGRVVPDGERHVEGRRVRRLRMRGRHPELRGRAGASRFWHSGIVLMLSVPPARTTRSMPAAIDPAAVAMAPRPAAQCRFVANPGICSRPSTTAVWRAMTPPPCRLSAMTRSSISLGSIFVRSSTARTTTWASSNASLVTSDPLRARPIGVRRAATITGYFMERSPARRETRTSRRQPPRP